MAGQAVGFNASQLISCRPPCPLPALQLAGLSALHTLLLHAPDWSLKNDAALLRLPRLRRLHLKYCPRVPACLGRLSQLEELHLYRLADAAGVDAALRPLTGLTSL